MKMMNNSDNLSLVQEMEKDKQDIESFVLETDKGTKRMKNRFYQQAVTDRNNFIEMRKEYYTAWLDNINSEISKRFERLMPTDCTDTYTKLGENLSNYLSLLVFNSKCSNSFKLKIDYLLSSINDSASLEIVNEKILDFINAFKKIGINLSIKDFNYTMFTEEYMTSFFKNHVYDSMREIFEEIYFKCPDIKLQLKLNLKYIIGKYNKQLGAYVSEKNSEMLNNLAVGKDEVYYKYVHLSKELEDSRSSDEYYNVKLFLDGTKKISDYLTNSATRIKNYNTFTINGDYEKLTDEEKKQFNSSVKGLYYTLGELKSYYKYEPIIKELIDLYKSKASAKNEFQSKKKEIAKEEKTRLSIFKKYSKSSGNGFLAKKDDAKRKQFILLMNQQIQKLNKLYNDYDLCDIKYKVSLLPESASIYDLLMTSISSYPFIEKWFLSEEFTNLSLEDNINDYIRFIFSSDNDFLFKTMVFSEFDITKIISDKYHLLGLNISSEEILSDHIDATLETLRYIYLIQSINKSKISIESIANMCKMSEIIAKKDN